MEVRKLVTCVYVIDFFETFRVPVTYRTVPRNRGSFRSLVACLLSRQCHAPHKRQVYTTSSFVANSAIQRCAHLDVQMVGGQRHSTGMSNATQH